ncbi:hypothetical protein [Xanthobacter agilis]|uniref:Xanthine dehydrogenase accessory factor n=1 Tax=Xanthobacter agilis TaxID=47492 RepID=A0ABU0LC03_XANAG|nr:hypothetical protein [Xanthobacter agilis]MDQ0504665.1 xanthine dehydrogenase accessory factor [Xanthobacter agilis]
MPDKSSVLVHGVNELASAVARTLLLSGHAVALHQSAPEPVLRRKMCFADAWWDGAATLGGVEARRVTRDAELVSGLSNRMFVPLLTHPDLEVVGRWPWDVVVDARGADDETGPRCGAELTLVLGPGATAGVDCDLVIEVGGVDPGAVLRSGPARGGGRAFSRYDTAVRAPAEGVFRSEKAIGEMVRAGEMIGLVGTTLAVAPCDGRLRGLVRPPRALKAGDLLAEVVANPAVQVSGIDRLDQIIARAVDFAIELEQSGASADDWGAGFKSHSRNPR